ncbi:MAG: oleate hydratase [Clostridium fessum]
MLSRMAASTAAFLGQFAETPRDTIFTTEYSVPHSDGGGVRPAVA